MLLKMSSVTRNLNIVAILTKNKDRKQFFMSIKLYIRLTYARSQFQNDDSVFRGNTVSRIQGVLPV